MVLPPAMVPVIERLAQNLFICPSAIAQHAALACFEDESIALYESRRQAFAQRRDYFVPALNALGLKVPVMPDGAFYAWADCTDACARLELKDSWDFSFAMMERAHVARMKKFLNFVGQSVDPEGRFLHAMRRAMTEAELFAVCTEHLLARADEPFADEPYPGVVARPNCETPDADGCSLASITA
jgi:DNA-binding transcriptional MocR family regulator